MTRIELARQGRITDEMRDVALAEGVEAEYIRKELAEGTIIISNNVLRRNIPPLAIGKGLRTKINANIGTSQDRLDINEELEKLKVSIEAGADAVMDLSTGGDIDAIRKTILKESSVPIGTVPIYQAALAAKNKGKSFVELSKDEFFRSGGDIDAIRKTILKESSVPIGTVPIYQAALAAKNKGKSFVELSKDEFF